MKFFESFSSPQKTVDAYKEMKKEESLLEESQRDLDKAVLKQEEAIKLLEMSPVIHEIDSINRKIVRIESGESTDTNVIELKDRLQELQTQLDEAGVKRD